MALLPVTAAAEDPAELALLGRLDRDAAAPVPVVAAGCPRFKLRTGPQPGKLLRELHEAHGMVAARSNAKTGTYEMAGLAVVPDEDPEPALHSPWEGMSGAAVWADERLVGVVAQHHPGEGRGTLTVRPVEALLRGPADRSARWRAVLGPRLPGRPGGLWLVRRATPGEAEADLVREVAARLAPPELQERDAVLADLDLLLASGERWCWVQGEAFVGKTALMAWLVTHPPPDVALASCFLRSTVGANTADYALSTLTGQLAALAERVDYHPARFLPEKRAQFAELLPAAARACCERGHRLVLLIDGLDEYDGGDGPLRAWLVGDDDLPADAALLAASRSEVDLDLPAGHPLRAHVLPLATTALAVELRDLAMGELRWALADRSRLEYAIVGLAAAAVGGLTPADLRALLQRMGISAFVVEISDVLGASLRRTVTPVPDLMRRAVYAFAHPALKDAARAMFAEDLGEFNATLLGWCDDYRDADWPEDMPDYVLSHYARHLHAAGRPDDLVALLGDRAWYQRNEASDPSAATYLSGVETAWRAAEELDEERIRAGLLADRLGAEIRACLTVSSVASLSGRISPRLLAALVSTGFWSMRRAFGVVRLAPAPKDRIELLIALAREGQDDDLRNDVVQAAMAATVGVADELKRASMWEKLAPLVPATLLDDALRLTGALPQLLPDHHRPRAIAEAALLAQVAAAGFPDRALDAIRAMKSHGDRARVLAKVARAIPADRTDEVLVLIRDLYWDWQQAETLAAFAVATLDDRADGQALLRKAFDAALDLASPEHDHWVPPQQGQQAPWVLRQLAPVLPEAWVYEALEAARARLEQGGWWMCLTALAARLGVLGQWSAALEVAHEFHGLVAVAPYAPKSERAALAEEMLDAVQKLDPVRVPGELAGVGPHLTESTIRRALDWISDLDGDTGTRAARALLPRLADLGHAQEAYDRALVGQEMGQILDWIPGIDAWADLIPHLPEPLRTQGCREALRLATSINDLRERLLACISQADALGDEAVGDILRSLSAMDSRERAHPLKMLVPSLPDLLLPEAIEVALTLDATSRFAGKAVSSPRADVLTALAPRLRGPLRDRALQAARAAAEEVETADERNDATLRIAVAFSAPDVATADAWDALTRQIEDAEPSHWRDNLVRKAGPFLPADLYKKVEAERQAADARRAERMNNWLATSPQRKAGTLQAATLHRALTEAQSIGSQELRAAALSRLAPHLMVLLERKDSDQTRNDWIRSRMDTLAALIPYLSHDQLPDALSVALDLLTTEADWPEPILASLAERLAMLPREQLYLPWRRALHSLAALHRKQTLTYLRSLGPLVTALGGQAAVGEFVRAVDETGNWWP